MLLRSLRGAALCGGALIWVLMVPSAQAGITSGLVTVDTLIGECDATIDAVPLLTRLMFDERLSSPLPGFLAGSRLVVHEATGTDANVRRNGALGSGQLYSHQDSSIVDSHKYDAFLLDLEDYSADARVSIISAQPRWLEATTSHSFAMHGPAPVASTAGAGDPRHRFYSDPDAPLLRAAVTDLSFAGDLTILVEETTFKVRSGATEDMYRAEDASMTDSAVDAENVRYFVLEVRDARLVLSKTIASAEFFTQIADIHCVGALIDASADTPIVIAEGPLHASPRAGPTGEILVPYTVSDEARATPQAANVGVAPSAFPYWGILLALGFVAMGGGATAWQVSRGARRPNIPMALPARVEAPPTIGPRSMTDLEDAFRADAANPVLAMELGLAYARKHQPHDALPLLHLAIQQYPKMDTLRYFAGIALLEIGRVDDALRHLSYAFRLSPLNVARFINEGAAQAHGHHAPVRAMLARWSRQFQESNARGYA